MSRGYYVQFAIQVDIKIETKPTGNAVGLEVAIKYFLADSNGNSPENPQFYRKSQKQLNRANRQKSKNYKKGTKPHSHNYHKARNRYARKHLRVSRQPREYPKRVAYCVVQSHDLIAYEDLNVKGMITNRRLAKSISDVAWSTFRLWHLLFWKQVRPNHSSSTTSKYFSELF